MKQPRLMIAVAFSMCVALGTSCSSKTTSSGGGGGGGGGSTFTPFVYLADQDTDGTFELYATQQSGSPVKIISSLPATASILAYRLNSDRSKVVFVADIDTDDVFELYVANVASGATTTKLSGTLVTDGDVSKFIGISPNDAQVVFVADKDTDTVDELYSVAISGGTPVKLNGTLVSGGDVLGFEITPNSATVGYAADQTTDDVFELYSRPIDGSGSATLISTGITNGTGLPTDFLAKITSDSATVVFTYKVDETLEPEEDRLFAAPVDGSATPTPLDGNNNSLTLADNIFDFDISDDDMNVVYVSDQDTNTRQELYVVAITGGSNTKLATLTLNRDVEDVIMSPNNTHALIRADITTDDIFELYYVPIDGSSAPTKVNPALVGSGTITDQFAFNSDGSKIYYIADQDTAGTNELYEVAASTLATSTKVNGTLVTMGNVQSFGITGSTMYYLADQTTDAVNELFSVPLSSLGTSTKVNGTLVTDGNVVSFGSSGEAP
ncbi:MAG: hypothetical protein R3A11_06895 [Bdellovibrionota bacterium]